VRAVENGHVAANGVGNTEPGLDASLERRDVDEDERTLQLGPLDAAGFGW
jgi:hypothetical protein